MKSEYKIEKNIPIPEGTGHAQGLTAAVRRLEVGESLLVAENQRSTVHAAAKKAKIAVLTRTTGEKVRVWRTA